MAQQILGMDISIPGRPQAERTAAFTVETLDGEVVPLKDFPAMRALQGEIVQGHILAIRYPDHTVWVSATASPIRTPEGKMLGAVLNFADISEVMRLQQERERLLTEVQRSAAELEAIITAIVDPVAAYDATGMVMRVNPAMVMTLGRDPLGIDCEGITRALAMRYPDGRFMRCEETPAMRALQGEHVVGERLLITDVDGHEMVVEVSATSLELNAQRWGVVSLLHDITTRERLREATERQAAELDATLNSIADGVVVYAATGEILRANPAAEYFLAYTVQEQAESVAERWLARHARTPDGQPIAPEAIPTERALHGEIVHGMIVMFPQSAKGDLWLSISAAPIRTPDGKTHGAVATYTDITAVRALQEQQKALLQTVSHDLRAPLAVIKGHEQVAASMLEEKGVDGVIKQSLAAIDRSVNRMELMIQDLVDVARWEGGHLELKREAVEFPHYLADLLQRVSQSMETPRIQVEMPADLPAVSADYARLERILVNLLSNALKYSDPGTPVCLRAWQEEGQVVVAVSDQGRGKPRGTG